MSYKSETIAEVIPRLNVSYLLPAMQREFVWTEDQVCKLFDSLMRQYPISSFLFWQVPAESRDDVEAYEFLYHVKESGNRAQMARIRDSRDITFVLDGQQRLTALLVGLEGTYSGRRAKSCKGARTPVPKKLFLDLLHDGRCPDADGETYYRFEFFEYTPTLTRKVSYWFEVKRILNVEHDRGLRSFIDDQMSVFKNVTGIKLSSDKADIFEHNLTRLYNAIWSDDAISYYMETDPNHERILEIFVRANSGGTQLSRSDLLLSTLTLHWGSGNAREEINEFVNELNTGLTRKNRLNKDFVMKSCLVLLDFQVAYRVSSFNKETCACIRDRWGEIKRAIKRTVDAANA